MYYHQLGPALRVDVPWIYARILSYPIIPYKLSPPVTVCLLTINMWEVAIIFLNFLLILSHTSEATNSSDSGKPSARDRDSSKVFSVFNVVTFPNSACGATSGYNGTCYTSSGKSSEIVVVISSG